MAKVKKTKTLVCKQIKYNSDQTNSTFRDDLAKALVAKRIASSRREKISDADDHQVYRQVLKFSVETDVVYGLIGTYELGHNAMSLVDDQAVEQVEVEQVAPPKNQDGKRREFISSLMYFCAFRNYVVLMQSMELRAKQFETHINWLLRDASVIKDSESLTLADQIPQQTRERIRHSHVREVTLGGQPFGASSNSNPVPDQKTDRSSKVVQLTEVAGDMVRKLLGEVEFSKLKLDELGTSNIEYSLKIRYKKMTNEKGQKLLDSLAIALRNVDEDDTKIVLNGSGGTIQGKDLKLSTNARIDTYGGFPDATMVFQEMRVWLHRLAKERMISA